jgi:type I restriction enzyme S subunit
MSEWKEYKLGDLIILNYGKALKSENRISGEIPVYSSAGITGFHNQYLINSKSLIVGRKGTIGKVYKCDTPFWCIDTAYYILPDDTKYNFDFLFYLIKTLGLEELNEDSAVPGLNRETAYSQIINLPSLSEQTAIASVLSSLDDKIDLLHRQNATLKKMEETLFRQWFVEETKEEWGTGKLGDLVVIKYGKDHKKLLDGNIPVFGSGGLMRHADKALYDKESVLIPRKGSLNNVMFFDEPFWTVDTMFYTEMKKPNIAKFVYHFIKELDLASMNVGSAVPSMTTEVLNNITIDIPSNVVFEKFENAVVPFYNKIKSNKIQIRTLTQIRDTLLPKLMSGEVRIENKNKQQSIINYL